MKSPFNSIIASILLVLTSSHGPALARDFPSENSRQKPEAWQRLVATHGEDWRAIRDAPGSRASQILGGQTSPRSLSPAAIAIGFAEDYLEVFVKRTPDLGVRQDRTRSSPDGHIVYLRQQYRGLDVEPGEMAVRLDKLGRVHQVTSSFRDIGPVSIVPEFGTPSVEPLLNALFPGEDLRTVSEPKLVVLAQEIPRLVYRCQVEVGESAIPWLLMLDARTGETLRRVKTVITEPMPSNAWLDHEPPDDLNKAEIDGCTYEWDNNGDLNSILLDEYANPPDGYTTEWVMNPMEPDCELCYDRAGFTVAGLGLLPCISFDVEIDYWVQSWDSWTSEWQIGCGHFAYCGPDPDAGRGGGYWDLFEVTLNSEMFPWDPTRSSFPLDLNCTTVFDDTESIMPGLWWGFGGDVWGDGVQCSRSGSIAWNYEELDSTKDVYLALMLLSNASSPDFRWPTWGQFDVTLRAQSQVYDVGPIGYVEGDYPLDLDDSKDAILCEAYTPVDLRFLDAPAPPDYDPSGDPMYKLSGSYVDIRDEIFPPNLEPAYSPVAQWPYLRDCDPFESVMAYHHISENADYLNLLGYGSLTTPPLTVDPHNLTLVDGSDTYYLAGNASNPFGNGWIVLGTNGVDAGEDPDVILHEYGHAIQDRQRPGLYYIGGGDAGFGEETLAMGEGFADYWACSSLQVASNQHNMNPAALAEWYALDSSGLRGVDSPNTYPLSMNGYVGILAEEHEDGMIWSACLWDLQRRLGRSAADDLVLKQHELIQPTGTRAGPTFVDGARMILSVDASVNAGVYREDIIEVFRDRGIFRSVSFESRPLGVVIEVVEPDLREETSGVTPFDRDYAFDQVIHATAPSSLGPDGFKRWVFSNVAYDESPQGFNVVVDERAEVLGLPQIVLVAEYTFDTTEGASTVEPIDMTTGATPITVEFSNITAPGNTSLYTSTSGPPLSSGSPPKRDGQPLQAGPYYVLTTSASHAGPIQVTVRYDEANLSGVESSLRAWTYMPKVNPPGWRDVTEGLDELANEITATVNTLSTLVLIHFDATAVDPSRDSAPMRVALHPNIPNPFNPRTVLDYDVPRGGARVSLRIYDTKGRLVRTLVDEWKQEGGDSVEWNARDSEGHRLPSGVYFAQIQAGSTSAIRKLVLLK